MRALDNGNLQAGKAQPHVGRRKLAGRPASHSAFGLRPISDIVPPDCNAPDRLSLIG